MAYDALYANRVDLKVINSHQRILARIKERVERAALAEYDALGSWDDEAMERFIQRVIPILENGQRQTGMATNAYLKAMARLSSQQVPEDAEPAIWARKTEPEKAYARPVKAARRGFSETEDVAFAKKAGRDRLVSLIKTDLQLAQTHTAFGSVQSMAGIDGYRRVLTGSENCALCVLASTNHYRRGNLMPIHHGCDCTVAPMYGDADPGYEMNRRRYLDLHSSIQEQFDAKSYDGIKPLDYQKIMVREHGEVGPVLTWRDQNFTGPDDL
jgi:hypothetical protein